MPMKVIFKNVQSRGGKGDLFKTFNLESSFNILYLHRFVALYPDQVKKISRQEFDGLLQEFSEDILPNNDKLYNRVVAVSNRLLEGNKDLRQIYDKSWTVTVVDQPVRNAFVLPSGNIFVFRGMLDLCKNDDQLGIVIGHEMAHAVLGHVAEQLTMAGFVR